MMHRMSLPCFAELRLSETPTWLVSCLPGLRLPPIEPGGRACGSDRKAEAAYRVDVKMSLKSHQIAEAAFGNAIRSNCRGSPTDQFSRTEDFITIVWPLTRSVE